MRPPINATGIILHAAMAGPPLATKALMALDERTYAFTEPKQIAGSGQYNSFGRAEELLGRLSKAEDALVLNNLSAAVLLVFHSLARDREVIVSREELHRDAFSFSFSKIARASGARLKEMDINEPSAPGDYSNVISDYSGLILKIGGLCASPKHALLKTDLPAQPGRKHNLPVVQILAHAALLNLVPFGLPEGLYVGLLTGDADLLLFSGDQLIGGPPAGIIVGKSKYVSLLREEALTASLSADRMVYTALEATLELYRSKEEALQEIPLLRMISATPSSIKQRARRLYDGLREALGEDFNLSITAEEACLWEKEPHLGRLPSFQVTLSSERLSASRLCELLYKGDPPVLGRLKKGSLLLDLRSVEEKEDDLLLNCLLSRLKMEKKREIRILDTVPSLIWMLDKEAVFVFANKACEKFWGLEHGSLLGKKISAVLKPEETGPLLEAMERVRRSGEKIELEMPISCSEGKDNCFLVILSPVFDQQSAVNEVTFTASDITKRKQAEEKLKYISMHDSLTGLYNRLYFEEEMRRLNNARHYPISIVISDLDGLKLTNDILGHEKGDRLLQAASALIKKPFRASDVVARVGGDEFAVILPLTGKRAAGEICERINKSIEEYNRENKGVILSLSIGYATGEEPSQDITEIYNHADNNMYKNKFANRETVKKKVLNSLLNFLAEKDFACEDRLQRIQRLILMLGQAVGLQAQQVENLLLLAKVYDLGKASIDDSIILKEGALSEAEWEEIKRHPETGYRLARYSPETAPLADYILQHHERWDGKGYPGGLQGKEIHLYSRILAIVDAYEAMTSPRPYRRPLSHKEAVAELKKNSGLQFDPRLVEIFINLIDQDDLISYGGF